MSQKADDVFKNQLFSEFGGFNFTFDLQLDNFDSDPVKSKSTNF